MNENLKSATMDIFFQESDQEQNLIWTYENHQVMNYGNGGKFTPHTDCNIRFKYDEYYSDEVYRISIISLYFFVSLGNLCNISRNWK